jgi:hypothetical protein
MAGSLVTRPCPRAKALAAPHAPVKRGTEICKSLAKRAGDRLRCERRAKSPLFSASENSDFQIFPKLFLAILWNIRTLRVKKF